MRPLTEAAMTIAASMILVDHTAVPLATPRAVDDLRDNEQRPAARAQADGGARLRAARRR